MSNRPELIDLTNQASYARCSGPHCQALIRWVMSVGGKRLAIDPDPHPSGTVVIRHDDQGRPRAHVLPGDQLPAQEIAWRAHWSTCPDSDAFRHRKAAATARCRVCREPLDPWLVKRGERAHIGCAPRWGAR